MNEGLRFTSKIMSVGAEVSHLDMSKPLTEEAKQALRDLWLKTGLLVFRNTPVTHEQHLALSRVFGEIEMHPIEQMRAKEDRFFMELGGEKTTSPPLVYNGTELRRGRLPFHRDTAYIPDICAGAMLRLVEIPDEGGETLIADTEKAYDMLPEALKQRIENLEFKATLRIGPFSQSGLGATWSTVRWPTKEEWPHPLEAEPASDVVDQYPSVVHPVVMKHPATGRKCIYFSPTYVDGFLGLTDRQSESLLAELVGYMLDPSNIYVHTWRPNDLLLWDNRRVLHASYGYHPNCKRRALRTTLKETLHSGRYYRE